MIENLIMDKDKIKSDYQAMLNQIEQEIREIYESVKEEELV